MMQNQKNLSLLSETIHKWAMKEKLDEVQGLLLVYQGFYLNANLSIKQVLISNQTEDSVNCACLEQYWVIMSLYTLLSM